MPETVDALVTAPDTEAAVGLLPRDGAVMQRLLANHQQFLHFLERRLGRRDVAEEVLQEAYARSVSAGAALRDEGSAVAWFYRMLRNALVDHHRRSQSEQRALAALEEAAASGGAPSDEPDEALMRAVCRCVSDLLATLKPEYAQAIRRVDMEDATLAELAAEAGISPGNAAVRLHRSRQAMRKRIEQCCGACAKQGCLHEDCTCG